METLTLVVLSGLTLGAMYALSAIGLSLIWGALGMLNMAHGSLLAIGGYSCYAPPGVMTAGYEELHDPIGPIHWAGTEMATTYQGYVEGALEAADRAVTEVLSALTSSASFPS